MCFFFCLFSLLGCTDDGIKCVFLVEVKCNECALCADAGCYDHRVFACCFFSFSEHKTHERAHTHIHLRSRTHYHIETINGTSDTPTKLGAFVRDGPQSFASWKFHNEFRVIWEWKSHVEPFGVCDCRLRGAEGLKYVIRGNGNRAKFFALLINAKDRIKLFDYRFICVNTFEIEFLCSPFIGCVCVLVVCDVIGIFGCFDYYDCCACMRACSLAKSCLQLYSYSIHTQRLFSLFLQRCDTFSRVRALHFAYTASVERQPQLQRTQQQVILWKWIGLRGPNIESNLFFYICPVVLLCIASVVFYFSFRSIRSALSLRASNLQTHSLHLTLASVDNRFIESVVEIFGVILFTIRCLARATLLPLLTLLGTYVHVCFPALATSRWTQHKGNNNKEVCE